MNYFGQHFQREGLLENLGGKQPAAPPPPTAHSRSFLPREHRNRGGPGGYNFDNLLFKHNTINYCRSRVYESKTLLLLQDLASHKEAEGNSEVRHSSICWLWWLWDYRHGKNSSHCTCERVNFTVYQLPLDR